jgi:hypothetical protein
MGWFLIASVVVLSSYGTGDISFPSRLRYVCWKTPFTLPNCIVCTICPGGPSFNTLGECKNFCGIPDGQPAQISTILEPKPEVMVVPITLEEKFWSKDPFPLAPESDISQMRKPALQTLRGISQPRSLPHVINRQFCPSGYDIVVVLDGSASPNDFYWMKQHAVASLKTAVNAGLQIRIGAIQTSAQHPEFQLTTYRYPERALAELLKVERIPGLHRGNETLNYIKRQMFGSLTISRDKLIFYLASTLSQSPVHDTAALLRQTGVRIRTVGVGVTGKIWRERRARRQLVDMAGSTENYYEIPEMNRYLC